MLGDVGLHEQGGPLGVDARGEELRRRHPGAGAQLLGVVLDGDRVQVGDEVEASWSSCSATHWRSAPR